MTRLDRSPARAALAAAAVALAGGSPGLADATPSLLVPGSFVYGCGGHGNGNGYSGISLEKSFVPGEYKCKEQSVTPDGGAASARASYTGPTGGTAGGGGKAKYGAVQTQSDDATFGTEGGRAVSGFVDGWTLTAPGHATGERLTVFVQFKVHGHLEGHGPVAREKMFAELFFKGSGAAFKTWSLASDVSHQDVSLDVDETVPLSFTAQFGLPFQLATVLGAESGALTSGTLNTGQVLGKPRGLTWGGILAVYDQAGNPVADWSLATDSGVDWRQACPCQVP
ncbi:MAG: hypothetical protein U1F53_21525 [Burkholderiaceae bacterium]